MTVAETEIFPEVEREMILLEQIESDPDVTQATLADKLGVAVGTVNWHLKRLVAKGYVKVKRAQRRKLRYIITPEGLALRARLTVNYIETSLRLYRRIRQHVLELLSEASQAGYHGIIIDGDGDIADICRLTCLEQGFKVIEKRSASTEDSAGISAAHEIRATPPKVPVLEVRGTKVILRPEVVRSETVRSDNVRMEAK